MVGLFVFTSLLWTRLLAVTVAVGVAFWLVRWLAMGKFSIRTPADWGILLLTLMAGVSCLITALPGTTIPQVLRLLTGVLLFYAVVNWTRAIERSDWLLSILALAGLSLSVFALVSVDWAVTKLPFVPENIYRLIPILVSDTVHPNVMAGTLLLFAPLFFSVVVFNGWSFPAGRERKIAVTLCWLSLTVTTLIILLTASRGAWIALFAVFALLISLRWKWGLLFIVALAVGVALLLYLIEPFDLLGIALENQTLGSLQARYEVITQALSIIEVVPFTGVGMGLFVEAASLIAPTQISSATEVAEHAHNLFLQIAVDLGIPGLIAWLSVLIAVFVAAGKLYQTGRQVNDHWAAGLGAGFLCSAAALALHGLLDSVVWGMVRQAPLVWLLWGATIASSLVYLPAKTTIAKSDKIVSGVDNGGVFDISSV